MTQPPKMTAVIAITPMKRNQPTKIEFIGDSTEDAENFPRNRFRGRSRITVLCRRGRLNQRFSTKYAIPICCVRVRAAFIAAAHHRGQSHAAVHAELIVSFDTLPAFLTDDSTSIANRRGVITMGPGLRWHSRRHRGGLLQRRRPGDGKGAEEFVGRCVSLIKPRVRLFKNLVEIFGNLGIDLARQVRSGGSFTGE